MTLFNHQHCQHPQCHLPKPAPLIKTANPELSKELTAPASPGTPHGEADAQRAMSHTEAWTPTFNRRRSWTQEEHKHALQMGGIGDVEAGAGFSQKGS